MASSVSNNKLGFICRNEVFQNLKVDAISLGSTNTKVGMTLACEIDLSTTGKSGGNHNCVVAGNTSTSATLPAGYKVIRSSIRVLSTIVAGSAINLSIGTTSNPAVFQSATPYNSAPFDAISTTLKCTSQTSAYEVQNDGENIIYNLDGAATSGGHMFVYLELVPIN